ncbi:LysR substrate-binding domain-containing protein [Billgrantia endophytica]|uniref:LysR family transcriptional regulator n=1 Tax=Billgrantia endophytica TaxID=2033802 RepID=A0A2N7UAR1_9GAMM|nr:LysR substrate-binding domain-containing protein [Halomonas endophytica]PMR77514.1 LysR family transcriptional regulator [Halomonas endophytica]
MRRFDFVTLKLFVSIADEGRLTAAAEREHMALAAVSKRISDLESLVGTALLYRRPRGVELTPAGHAFLHHARRILENIDQLQAELSEYGEGVKGHVRIHSNTSAIIAFLPQDLSTFSREYPQIKIDLQERVSSEVIAAARDGLTDVGIFAGHVPCESLQLLPYRSDRLVLMTPRDHPLAERESLYLHEATNFDFIGLQQDASLQALLHEQAGRAGKTLRMRIQVRSFDAICRMIHHGMGVGVLPEKTIYRDLRDLQLCSIPLSDEWARRELVIGVRQYDELSVIARHLVDHLTSPSRTDGDQSLRTMVNGDHC